MLHVKCWWGCGPVNNQIEFKEQLVGWPLWQRWSPLLSNRHPRVMNDVTSILSKQSRVISVTTAILSNFPSSIDFHEVSQSSSGPLKRIDSQNFRMHSNSYRLEYSRIMLCRWCTLIHLIYQKIKQFSSYRLKTHYTLHIGFITLTIWNNFRK